MQRMICRNRVKDFEIWKAMFDENLPAGRAAGLELESLWRASDDPNDVFFVFTVADRGRAELFISAPESAELGERSGVIDGDCWFVE